MSVTNLTNTVTYIGDGVTVHFPYNFPLQQDSDMQVWITNPAGVPTQIFTNFQVDAPNTRVIYPTTGSPLPADGSKITLLRVVPVTQETVLTDTGPLPATVLEKAYDKLTMIVQQLLEKLGRTLQFPVGTTPDPTNSALLLAEIQAGAANAAAAAASAAAAAASAASIATPIPIARGGTNSTTALVNGRFMQSSSGAIVESAIDVASFSGFLPGMSVDYRGTVAPAGWELEDGGLLVIASFPALFAVIQTTYNTGSEPAGTFRKPDSRGRVNVGAGTGASLSARTVGQSLGEETHVLTTQEMPTHGHGVNDPGHSHTLRDSNVGIQTTAVAVSQGADPGAGRIDYAAINPAGTAITIQASGNSTPHNIMQPSLVALKIIKT